MAGFTLIELLLALGLFLLATAGSLSVLLDAQRASEQAARSLRAITLLEDVLQRRAMLPGIDALPARPAESTSVPITAGCRAPVRCAPEEFAAMQLRVARGAVAPVSGAEETSMPLLPAARLCNAEITRGFAVTLIWPAQAASYNSAAVPSCWRSDGAWQFLSAWIFRGEVG